MMENTCRSCETVFPWHGDEDVIPALCPACEDEQAELDAEFEDDDFEDSLSDVDADAMTLRDCGMGTDEDYGYFGGDEY